MQPHIPTEEDVTLLPEGNSDTQFARFEKKPNFRMIPKVVLCGPLKVVLVKGISGTSAGAAALKVTQPVLGNSADTCSSGRNGKTFKRQDVTLAIGDTRTGSPLPEASPIHQSSPTGM